jgi:uncharacterized protein YabE (DUF348 family)
VLQNMKKLFSDSARKRRNIAIAVGSVVALSSGVGYGAYEATKETVTLSLNGKEKTIRTHANTVEEMLRDNDVKVGPHDYVYPSGNTAITDNLKVVYETAKPVQLVIDQEQKQIWTTADSVQELLKQQHIKLNEHDQVKPGLDAPLTNDLKIEIERAFQVTVNVGGKKQQVWSTSTTVADFLKKQQVKLNELDRVEPGLEEKITKGSVVNVIRVEKVTDVVEEPIKYAVVTKKDSNLQKGKQKVLESGKEGLVEKHYEVILENGKEVSRKLVKTETVRESQDRVVAVGTREIRQQVSRGTESVAKEFYVTATAYTAYCNGCSGTTATGVNLRANPNVKVIAVDPKIIPLGSKVYVEGYGYAIASDTGSSIRGYKIDVFFPDKSSAYRWGRKKVKVKVLN